MCARLCCPSLSFTHTPCLQEDDDDGGLDTDSFDTGLSKVMDDEDQEDKEARAEKEASEVEEEEEEMEEEEQEESFDEDEEDDEGTDSQKCFP